MLRERTVVVLNRLSSLFVKMTFEQILEVKVWLCGNFKKKKCCRQKGQELRPKGRCMPGVFKE